MVRIDVEPATFGKILIIITWLFTLLDFFLMYTGCGSPARCTNYVGGYFLIFLGSSFLCVVDWIIVETLFSGEQRGIKSEMFNTTTFDIDPARHPAQLFLKSVGIILFLSIAIGLVWGGYYYYGIVSSHGTQQYIGVPDLFASVPLGDSPLPFIDTATATAFQEAFAVAVTEEQVLVGVFSQTLMGILLLFFAIIGLARSEEGFIASVLISLIIVIFVGSYVSGVMMHKYAYQQQQSAYEASVNHFRTAIAVDTVLGNTIPSIIAHFMHNFAYKQQRYHRSFSIIPPEELTYISP